MWTIYKNNVMSYVIICKDIKNIGYYMMSQLLKAKVQRIDIY